MAREQPTSTRFFDATSAPAVAVLTVAAIAVFVADLAKKDVSPLVLDVRAFMGEPWRIFTTSLPHESALHLGFNLLWLIRLGVPIEKRLGTVRFALFALLVDGGASVAEYALGGSGVGLSGLGYALAGFGWVARHDPRFAGLVDRRTALLFVGWFFLCIGATLTNVMNVANVAHGAGAVFGGLAAVIVTSRGMGKRATAVLLGAGLLALSWLGATTYRPWVNLSKSPGADSAYLGWKHLDADEYAAAVPFLREAVRVEPKRSRSWHNLGLALRELGQDDESLAAFRRANEVEPGDDRTSALAHALLWSSGKALEARDFDRLGAICAEGERLVPDDEDFRACSAVARQRPSSVPPAE